MKKLKRKMIWIYKRVLPEVPSLGKWVSFVYTSEVRVFTKVFFVRSPVLESIV